MSRFGPIIASIGLFAGTVGVFAQEVAPDYVKPESWICHPNTSNDACDRDLSVTTVSANGKLGKRSATEARDPPIDCFYVYPTTSLDQTMVSDLTPGKDEELITAYVQAARFRSQCRVFAPLYRQNTVTSLRAAAAGRPMSGDRSVIYNDVLNAWNHYLRNENHGRGFVLIGHSQGAGLLTRLIAAEIDGKPLQKQLVSALIIGSAVSVPKGAIVGGSFKHIPLCSAADEIGCVITFASFRATIPPPANSNFGRVRGNEGSVAGCTNPAALLQGKRGKVELDAILSNTGEISLARKDYLPWSSAAKVETPFVTVPGLLHGECVQRGEFSYLEVTINANPTDPRTDDIIGDLISNDEVNAAWGLHLIDMSLVMGDLVEIVKRQSKAYGKR